MNLKKIINSSLVGLTLFSSCKSLPQRFQKINPKYLIEGGEPGYEKLSEAIKKRIEEGSIEVFTDEALSYIGGNRELPKDFYEE